MNRDRGTMKWASLMLPEHVKLLQHIWREDVKVNKPELDEQELGLINNEFMMAYEQNEEIELTIYHGGRIEKRLGIITGVNKGKEKVYLQMADGNKAIISFKNILSLMIK